MNIRAGACTSPVKPLAAVMLLSLALSLILSGGARAQGDAFCPAVIILPLTGSIAVFESAQDDAAEGDIAYAASLDSATITCKEESDSLPVRADIAFTGVAESDSGRIVTGMLPVFASLVSRNNILLKKAIEEQAIVLTAEMNRIAYNGNFRDMPIPLLSTGARAGMRYVIGFQLDEEQLSHNRRLAAQTATARPAQGARKMQGAQDGATNAIDIENTP